MTIQQVRALSHWEKEIADPTERKVFKALADLAWDFRTVEGISKTTSLSDSQVNEILAKYPRFVRKSAVPNREGKELFTLHSRPIKLRERLALIRMSLAKDFR